MRARATRVLAGLMMVGLVFTQTAQASCRTKAEKLLENRGHVPGKNVDTPAAQVNVLVKAKELTAEILFGRLVRAIRFYKQVEEGGGPAVEKLYWKMVKATRGVPKFATYPSFVGLLQGGNQDESLCPSEHHIPSQGQLLKMTAEDLGLIE